MIILHYHLQLQFKYTNYFIVKESDLAFVHLFDLQICFVGVSHSSGSK